MILWSFSYNYKPINSKDKYEKKKKQKTSTGDEPDIILTNENFLTKMKIIQELNTFPI